VVDGPHSQPGIDRRRISALDVASGWEDFGTDVFMDVLSERGEQIDKGYTPEHDDAEGGDHLIQIARSYLFDSPPNSETSDDVRRRVVKAMATLLATVEYIDRQRSLALVATLDIEDAVEEIEQAIQSPHEGEQTDHEGMRIARRSIEKDARNHRSCRCSRRECSGNPCGRERRAR